MLAIFNKRKKSIKEIEEEIRTGQVSTVSSGEQNITSDRWKTTDLLTALTTTQDKIDAIDLIVDKTPDGKMALNTYLRIANQGVKIELYKSKTGKRAQKYEKEMRDFCAKIGGNTSNGIDGIMDQLHSSAILHGGMAVEVVVNDDVTDIENLVIVDPKTITDFKWLPDKKRWAAYQKSADGELVDLYEGNFFWIPHQPKPGRPDGTLQFEPAIVTMTQMYQLLRDSLKVLNRIGFPKYDVKIVLEELLKSATPDQLSDPDKRKKLIEKTFSEVQSGMTRISTNSNIIHFDSTEVGVIGGGVNGSGIDVRAWFEMLEPLIVNSFQLTPVLMGRLKSGSYSLGTAEYKIVKDTMEVLRRNSKRMLENIINIWARVKGYDVYAVVNHNPIEWQIEKEKYEAMLLKMERARRAEEYHYIDHEDASQMSLGDDANTQPVQENLYEYLNKYLSADSESDSESEPIIEE